MNITLHLTNRCNLACKYCYVDKKYPADMPLDVAKQAIDMGIMSSKSQMGISFFGLSMLIYGVLKPLFDKIPWYIQFIIWTFLYLIFFDFPESNTIHLFIKDVGIPDVLTTNQYLYPIGITTSTFSSADYFPLVPWLFVFLAGTALSVPIIQKKFPKWFYQIRMPFLDFCGRKSLIIYILHQPIIYGVLSLIF
jgi:hypothetical protein